MRSLALAIVVFGSLPFIFFWPHVGVLMWSWLSYMNPHQMVWGFAAGFPFAYWVALVTMAGWFFSREPKRIPWNGITILLIALAFWINVTWQFALYPEDGVRNWDRANKILLFNGLVTLGLITSRQRLNWLLWVIAGSIGFFGLKGGFFTLLTGGNYRVWGAPGGMIEDNNALALALLMIFPLMRYLQVTATSLWVRWGILAWMVMTLVAIIGTHSRGALVGLIVMGAALFLKMRSRMLVGIVLAMALVLTLNFMPDKWMDRMATILEYQEDGSARGRLKAWAYAIDLASERPIVGGGFGAFAGNLKVADGSSTAATNAHSIYFEILGEQGYVGLVIFLLLGIATFRAASWTVRHARGHPELAWAQDLASMLQVSLFGYAAAGAFLNLAFFDLYYHLVVITVITRELVKAELAKKALPDSSSASVSPFGERPYAEDVVRTGRAPPARSGTGP